MNCAKLMNRPSDNPRARSLRALLAGEAAGVPPDVMITDLTLDSRSVQPGGAFVALPGTRTHGVGFAAQAVQAGARAILWEPVAGVAAPKLPANVALIAVPHLTNRLGAIADQFFDAPSSSVRVLGVTGTNGKTTTAHVLAAALQRLGESSAYSGTLGYGRVDALQTATHTTPDCITVHRQLAELRDDGVRLLGMEVSSHALDQHRVDGVRFDTAIFTNLSRDHLDYHGTLDAYGDAKAKLFAWPGLRRAVISIDDAFGRRLASHHRECATTLCSRSPSSFAELAGSRKDENDVKRLFATSVAVGASGLEIGIGGDYGVATLRSRFIGEFNLENLLAALATLLGLGVGMKDAIDALAQCAAPPGRMETLTAQGRPLAIIDYAHTPDALEKVLLAVRRHCAGALICVFGCGGERDPGKRPLMGAIAERLADRMIITDDNPRGENGDAIVADIVQGLTHPERAQIERDRAAAIERALREGVAGDAVLIAGKGHEDYQIVGAERRHFSDREVAQAALRGKP
jgi:UDP-N-acetylmuramoyl-L-alanyl-D-glutamate--2,6-diaminopimelate ligase